MEVDRPPAEEPVLDAGRVERSGDAGERREPGVRAPSSRSST